MTDQAGTLRTLVSQVQGSASSDASACYSIAITSGKGGVGKSNIAIFLARALALRGKKVLLFDGDLGLANLHILLGITTHHDLNAYLRHEQPLASLVCRVSAGVDLLPGGSGGNLAANMSAETVDRLVRELSALSAQYDILLVDSGAGIADNTLRFSVAADEVLLVMTPDPTSLSDAYATIKILKSLGQETVSIVQNMVETNSEAQVVEEKIRLLTEKFLEMTPRFIGRLPRNCRLASLIREDIGVLSARGLGQFAIKINMLAAYLLDVATLPATGENRFFARLLHRSRGKRDSI